MSGEDKVNILLVDDQPAKLLSYETILADLGENVLKAGSANQALELLLRHDVAVILLDVCMPDLDGFELAAMIREHPRFQSTALIFVSAVQVADMDLLRGYAAGAVDYVPVPVIPELLRAKVRVFAELYRKTKQLASLNAELERRVAERTTELEAANLELERRVEIRTREREAALAQIHEMQKVESLGQLTGGVAHDFNNLLMAVLGNLELLRKSLLNQPALLRLVDGAIKGVERGTGLTSRMLAFARRQELRPETVDIAKLVGNMVDMLDRSLGPSVQITTAFELGVRAVRVDPNQLELAILNLALNARDAMPEGGALKISSYGKQVTAGDDTGLLVGNYLCIAVSDTGVGMDEAILKRATEPFFTTKSPGKGTGLGLSMVYGLVAQSGGTMRIESKPGSGTTVELWLPVSEPEAFERMMLIQEATERSEPRRVLLVEDDPMVAAATSAMLEDLGHTVVEAISAERALELLRSDDAFDLVITDHAMPGMTGAELAMQIRHEWSSLPVVLSSGYSEVRKSVGDWPRLSKPFRQHELAALVAAVTCDAPAVATNSGHQTASGRTALG
jgi:signal transduction histidine kinase